MNRDSIRLCIIPTYQYTENDVCYMFNNKRNDKQILDSVWLDNALISLKCNYNILQTEIFIPDITVISDFYFTIIFHLIKSVCKKVLLTTNLIQFNKNIINCCDIINVNLNFNEFLLHKDNVYNNIKSISNKVINVKSFDISCYKNQEKIIYDLNMLGIKSWEIVPYHAYINSRLKTTDYSHFESLIKNYLFLTKKMNFAFQNKLQLDEVLCIDNYNVQTIYITPYNNFGVLDFTKNNEFQILEYDSVEKLQKKLTEMEKSRDIFCHYCDSKLRCLANRYQNLNYEGKSCSGFKDLIEFYNK